MPRGRRPGAREGSQGGPIGDGGIIAVLLLAVLGTLTAAGWGHATPLDVAPAVWGPAELPGVPPPAESEDPPSGTPGPPEAGAVILPHLPSDYSWWNGCSPTAGGMLFAWWELAGYDSFPGDPENLPASYSGTSSNPGDYADARGVIAGWAHKQEGTSQGLQYGSYDHHAPDSIADFILTHDGTTNRSAIAHGLETFGAWDDPRTTEIESRRFSASTVYVGSGWTYNDYVAEIDAGRPVHLGLSTTTSSGHSMLAVGYNNTGGKQNIVALTTWGLGPVEWQWANQEYSGSTYNAYGATLMDVVPDPPPELSAYFSIAHPRISDLTVEIGVGDPDSPDWNTIIWDRDDASSDNLVLTDIDCSDVLSDYLAGPLSWYLKVTDQEDMLQGSIEDFQVRYGFDQEVVGYQGDSVPIIDHQTVRVCLETVPEPATAVLLLSALALLLLRRRRPGRDTGNRRG